MEMRNSSAVANIDGIFSRFVEAMLPFLCRHRRDRTRSLYRERHAKEGEQNLATLCGIHRELYRLPGDSKDEGSLRRSLRSTVVLSKKADLHKRNRQDQDRRELRTYISNAYPHGPTNGNKKRGQRAWPLDPSCLLIAMSTAPTTECEIPAGIGQSGLLSRISS